MMKNRVTLAALSHKTRMVALRRDRLSRLVGAPKMQGVRATGNALVCSSTEEEPIGEAAVLPGERD